MWSWPLAYCKQIVHRITHLIVTLKFSILSIFISLFALSSIILMTISYRNSSNDILYTANKSMQDITQSLNQLFVSEIKLAERDAKITSSLINSNVLNVNNIDEMINYFYSLAEQFNIVQAIYWGGANGDYVSAEYEDDDSITSNYDNQLTIPPSELTIRRDVNGNILSKTTHKSVYDPRTRPWFQAAQASKKPIWTDVYLYEPTKYLGITMATPVYDNNNLKGVLGVDIRLDWISWYIDTLKTTPHGILFVVQTDGKLIAYPNFDKLPKQSQLIDIHEIPAGWIPKAYDLHTKNKSRRFLFTYQGTNYYAAFRPVPMLKNQGWIIGLVVPEDDFIGVLNRARLINILISFVIMITGILIVSKLVNSIVKPVKTLIVETNKIKNFDLDNEDTIVKTRVKEIIQLSDAIDSMKNGLKAFKRYVPSELVKQLIKKGEHAKLGGSKKNLVALFSDIKGFTTIAHQSDPDQIVSQLNEYFEVFTNIIINEKGTIDKYIGDAVMAFWGAPDDINNPCHHAADAALCFIRKLDVLNKKWESEGKSPFHTRIGIHIGDAIVGNIGSSERINYTAIGDSINIASRLEGVNKEFNTSILVSQSVYNLIKDDFDLQEVGLVSLKGINEKILAYSLIGRKETYRI